MSVNIAITHFELKSNRVRLGYKTHAASTSNAFYIARVRVNSPLPGYVLRCPCCPGRVVARCVALYVMLHNTSVLNVSILVLLIIMGSFGKANTCYIDPNVYIKCAMKQRCNTPTKMKFRSVFLPRIHTIAHVQKMVQFSCV